MLPLFLTFALIFVGLAVVLFFASIWFQGYFYEQVVGGVSWRSVVVALIVSLVLAGWAFLETKNPGRFGSLFQFTASETQEFEQFWSERKQGETLFRKRTLPGGRTDYLDEAGKSWKRSENGVVTAIIVEENGERKKFFAKLDADGNFIRDPADKSKAAEVEYHEDGGKRRVMMENTIGRVVTSRGGVVVLNLLFNLGIMLVWFALLWQLLEFQSQHALLLAFIAWLVTCLAFMPMIQARLIP